MIRNADAVSHSISGPTVRDAGGHVPGKEPGSLDHWSRRTGSCHRKTGAPDVIEKNEVSVAGRRPMAHRGKPHGCPVRVVLLEVYWHGLTPRLGSVDG